MIHVHRIETHHVLGHDSVVLELPDRGVVVVTGDNGAGKSTLIEAVAAGLWGKTLRGGAWQQDGVDSVVRLRTAAVDVERERGGRTNRLRWSVPGGEAREFETATKAQAELDAVVGSLEAWRRTSVFSSQDVLSFSLATDAERKRLIEGMLGLHVFDAALGACRDDARSAAAASQGAASQVRTLLARLEGERKRLADAGDGAGPEPPAADAAKLRELEAALARAKKDLADARRTSTDAQRDAVVAGRKVDEARRALARIDGLDVCYACGQAVDTATKARMGAGARREISDAEAALPEHERRSEYARAEIDELSAELDALIARVDTTRLAVTLRQQWEQRQRFHAEKAARVREDVLRLEAELLDAEDAHAACEARVAELQAVERVLGLRGVRSHVIAGALAGLEAVTNAWLARLKPGVSVALRPDSATSAGGVSERISLDIVGVGHSEGYTGCSGGERRRVDVAMVLALAEMRAAAAGVRPGTLWFDEVFDTLDPAGVSSVAAALTEVSATRCVVVITHNEDLAAELDAVSRVRFVGGVAT